MMYGQDFLESIIPNPRSFREADGGVEFNVIFNLAGS